MHRKYRPAVLSPRARGLRALDQYTTSLWECYGLQRLLSSYNGPLIRVRRSSDNVEQDIPFGSDFQLDTSALLAFIGSNSAFVTKFYGQSGNARDLQQTGTTTKQPRIVNAGVYDGKAVFDASDDCMQTPNLPGTNTAMSYVMRGKIRAFPGSGYAVWLESTADAGLNAGLALYYDQSINLIIDVTGPPSTQSFARFAATAKPNDDVTCTTGNRATSVVKYYQAGAQVTPNSSSGGSNTGNYAASPLNVGARNNGATLPAQLDLNTLVVYTQELSAADVALISAALLTV